VKILSFTLVTAITKTVGVFFEMWLRGLEKNLQTSFENERSANLHQTTRQFRKTVLFE
jgi:hypothetical protein